jgi:serine acetyltransferase
VRIGADSTAKFDCGIHHAATIGYGPKKCKKKIPAIAGFVILALRYAAP